jgi:hypothetical protein
LRAKAYAYLYLTLNAKIGMDEKCPEILKESGSNISPQLFNLPPLILL